MTEQLITQILTAMNGLRADIAALQTTVTGVSNRLDKHMDEEEDEIAQIMEVLQTHREESDRRITNLIQSMNAYSDGLNSKLDGVCVKVDSMTAAFVHIDGKPDYPGHHEDHRTRKEVADEFNEIKKDVKKKVFGAGALAVATWLFYVIWEAFLRGPK